MFLNYMNTHHPESVTPNDDNDIVNVTPEIATDFFGHVSGERYR